MEDCGLPLVSIITPVYNRENFIEETIVSVINQEYAKMEYLVLDDGSTDNTLAIVKKYSDRLNWTHHPNIGETGTVNRGFALANGEIIGVVNSDDPLLPGAVANIVDYFSNHPEVMVVYPDWVMINAKGETVRKITTIDYDYVNMLRWHSCMPGPGTFFRRQVVEQLEGRDPRFTYIADFDFWLRAGLALNFARIPMTLATFREHQDSSSVCQKGPKMAKEHVALVKKIYALPDLPRAMRMVKKEAYSSAFYVAGIMIGDRAPLGRFYYFGLALLWAPHKYLGEYKYRLHIIFKVPRKRLKQLKKALRKRFKRLKRYFKQHQ